MTVRLPPSPSKIARLRKNPAGYPIPWFAADGTDDPDFRVIPEGKHVYAIRHHSCWICGQPLGRNRASVVGPMCAINRTSAEPPSHLECAIYSATACPFLTNPSRRRRTTDLPEGGWTAGVSIDRNPGVVLVWVSRNPRPFRPPDGRGVLFHIGEPEEVLWFAEARPATRLEVQESIAGGMPILEAAATKDGPAALAELGRRVADLGRLLPAL